MLQYSTTYDYETTNGSSVTLSQSSYSAYDAMGNVLLSYTPKTWTNANGQTLSSWVATITTYNLNGQATDTYTATYLDSGDHTLHFGIGSQTGTTGSVSVTNAIYNDATQSSGGTLQHTSHTVYTASGQTLASTDQYGDVTTNTYDAAGNLILTVYPDGTQVRSVYDALGRVIWQSDRFVPVNSDLTSSANTSDVTRTLYNSAGQAYRTERYSGVAILIEPDGDAGVSGIEKAVAPTGLSPSSSNFLSYTQNWYDEQGRVIETRDAAGLRTGTIYAADGSVEYTGPLSTTAPDGGHSTLNAGGTTSYGFGVSDFASYTQTLDNQIDTSSGNPWSVQLYTRTTDPDGNWTDAYQWTVASGGVGTLSFTVYEDGSYTETITSIGDTPIPLSALPSGVSIPSTLSIPESGSETVNIAQRKSSDTPQATFDVSDASGNLIGWG